jgi:alpha-ketoglutarate-dependent taurine dioxygenase
MPTTAEISVTSLDPAFGDIIQSDGEIGLYDLDRDWLIDRFRRRGCLLFRGFRATTESFERFSDSLGRDFSNYQGGGFRWGPLDRQSLNSQRTLLTATGKIQDFPIPVHGEVYYTARPPQMIWFYCARTASEGGETTVADGRAAYAALGESTRRLLSEHRIQYLRELVDGDWQVAFLTDDRGEIERVCREQGAVVTWTPDGSLRTRYECSALVDHPLRGRLFISSILPVAYGEMAIRKGIIPGMEARTGLAQFPMVVRLDNGEPIPSEAIEDMLAVSDAVSRPVQWQVGDLLVADNTWVLHGRRGSPAGGDRAIYVRMCAYDFPMED